MIRRAAHKKSRKIEGRGRNSFATANLRLVEQMARIQNEVQVALWRIFDFACAPLECGDSSPLSHTGKRRFAMWKTRSQKATMNRRTPKGHTTFKGFIKSAQLLSEGGSGMFINWPLAEPVPPRSSRCGFAPAALGASVSSAGVSPSVPSSLVHV